MTPAHVERRVDAGSVSDDSMILAVDATLQSDGVSGDVTVVLTDDAQLGELNLQYLGHDAPTDVLSFPAGDTDPETGRPYLGDVVISIPTAELQARTAGHGFQAEVQLLVVHGVLHLLGYDHATAADKAAMWSAQERVLTKLGLAGITVSE